MMLHEPIYLCQNTFVMLMDQIRMLKLAIAHQHVNHTAYIAILLQSCWMVVMVSAS